jgi:folate-binding protein YgfZ
MALESPLIGMHVERGGLVAQYGPGVRLAGEAGALGVAVGVVQLFGELELEYAALRKACVLIDCPQRATLVVTGGERLDFLNRMLTQELKGLPEFAVRRSFWLSRKGRIDADVRVLNLPGRVILDVDVHAAAKAQETLGSYIITEDCAIADATQAHHRLEVHGPTAGKLLDEVCGVVVSGLAEATAMVATIAGAEVVVDRWESAGVPGYSVLCPVELVKAVYGRLMEVGGVPAIGEVVPPHTRHAIGLRLSGWQAFNMARVEHGTPWFNLDFGGENLPAETGVLDDRVSFKKGCYLGQEIVARMHARGHPKQLLVGLLGPTPGVGGLEELDQPEGGMTLHLEASDGSESIGLVSSSTISPMLGASVICFGSVKFQHATAGREVFCRGARGWIGLKIQDGLRFVGTA